MNRNIVRALLLISFISFGSLLGQSNSAEIYLTDKTVIKGRIIQVTQYVIEVDPEGDIPFIIIPREDVELIIYADGTVQDFNASKPKDIKKPPESQLADRESEEQMRKLLIKRQERDKQRQKAIKFYKKSFVFGAAVGAVLGVLAGDDLEGIVVGSIGTGAFLTAFNFVYYSIEGLPE